MWTAILPFAQAGEDAAPTTAIPSETSQQDASPVQRVALDPVDKPASRTHPSDASPSNDPLPIAVSVVGLVLLVIGIVTLYRRERRRLPPH